jgi:mRNA interferase MazF
VSTQIRGFAAEVRLGKSEGLPKTCVINVDALTTIPKRALATRIGALTSTKQQQLDDALRFVLGLD